MADPSIPQMEVSPEDEVPVIVPPPSDDVAMTHQHHQHQHQHHHAHTAVQPQHGAQHILHPPNGVVAAPVVVHPHHETTAVNGLPLVVPTAPQAVVMVQHPPLMTSNAEEASPQDNIIGIKGDHEDLTPSPHEEQDLAATTTTEEATTATPGGGKRKRLCRYPGCHRVIKSQGHCQRHGAKAKRCKVVGCDKQAQGTHDGMCKRHWKSIHCPGSNTAKQEVQPPPPEGESVYDGVLPQSIAYRPSILDKQGVLQSSPTATPSSSMTNRNHLTNHQNHSKTSSSDGEDPPAPPGGVSVMPLVAYLREGASRELGWHRNQERRARGLFPMTSSSSQLEPWERQLALVEILLLSGGTPYANFKDLAHAWGREKGFHHVLTSSVCERRGEVERKKRSDAGKILTEQERENFRKKLKIARGTTTGMATTTPAAAAAAYPVGAAAMAAAAAAAAASSATGVAQI